MSEVNLKECCLHPATYAQSLLDRAEAAEARAAELQAHVAQLQDALKLADYHFNQAIEQRDCAAYEATMTAARISYDAAQQFKANGCIEYMSAAMVIFKQIAGEYAERKS